MMINFCKSEACPSSNELLEFQNADLPRSRAAEVAHHLKTCEFCEAEVGFYSNYPQAQDETREEPEAIPPPLFELAEALLKNRHGDSASLNALLKEKASWVVDKI